MKAQIDTRKMRGFSLLEMMAVLGIALIVSAITVFGAQPALKSWRVSNAYNITLAAMRQGRDLSIAQRQVYFVTLNNTVSPNIITITQGATGNVYASFQLPTDVSYLIVPGIPTAQTATPDGFGTASNAIDFDQGIAGGVKNVIYFYPDGSAQDINGNINNGVVYIARANELYSSHAITVWGATGRLRGWRLYNNLGNLYWRQM
jgi:prepilin-type N-terminal cleavage/methylation domain-containing protein